MNTAKIDKYVWVLIYVGMAVLALGLWSLRSNPDASAGVLLAACGAALIAAGIALLFVRARLRGPADAPPATPSTSRDKGTP